MLLGGAIMIGMREKAQRSYNLFTQAQNLKRNGQYQAALRTYKQAYEAFPEDPDLQSTMYAMAKVYLLMGNYETAYNLFKDGLTQKLAQDDNRTARFYKNFMTGRIDSSNPEFTWFYKTVEDYTIFIGLTHYLIEDESGFLRVFRNDFNNHIQAVRGNSNGPISNQYFQTCFEKGWARTIATACESCDRCFDGFDFGHRETRKQEFLDVLKTIN